MLASAISQSLNIAILPIIIIPVTGICCMLFYNRHSAIINYKHTLQKELRELLINSKEIDNDKEKLIHSLTEETHALYKKSNWIRNAILLCFLGILAFVLSAVSIILGAFWNEISIVTLILWCLGALFFALGIIIGMVEIKSGTLQTLQLERVLISSPHNNSD